MWNHGTRLAMPALAPFLREELSLTIFQTTSYVVAPMISFYASILFAGHIVIRIGYKRAVVISAVGAAASFAAAGYSNDTTLLFILLVSTGVFLGLYLPAAIPWVSSLFAGRRRGLIIGIHEAAAPTGQTLGPVVTALLAAALPLGSVFLIWALAPLAAGLLLMALAPSTSSVAEQARVDAKLMPPRRLLTVIAVTVGVLIGNMGVVQIIPLYLVDVFGLEKAFAGMVVGLSRLLGLVGQPLGGFLSDRYGRVNVMTVLTILTLLSTAYIAYAPYNMLYIIFLVIQATCTAMYFPVTYALISEESGAYASIQISRLLFTSGLLGPVLTGFVMGYLAEEMGYTTALTYPLVFTMLSVAAAPLLRKRIITTPGLGDGDGKRAGGV